MGGGGGGGHSPPNFGRYVTYLPKFGVSAPRPPGCRGKVKMGVSGTEFVGRVWLALWPADNPGALRRLPDCPLAFGLAAVSRPWAAMNGLEGK